MMNNKEILQYFYDNQDLKYRDFHLSLKGSNDMIGVRSPIVKDLAKKISKGNYQDFIRNNSRDNYELILLEGYLLGYLSLPFEELIEKLDNLLPYLNSWALIDMTAGNLKIFKKNKELGFNYITKLLDKDNWSKRMGLVLLLDYYINDKYIGKVLELTSKINNNDYYVYMAKSWLLSVCYVKYSNETYPYIMKLDDITKRKTISKTNDSYRVSKENKNKIKQG